MNLSKDEVRLLLRVINWVRSYSNDYGDDEILLNLKGRLEAMAK